MRVTSYVFSDITTRAADKELRAGVWNLWPAYDVKSSKGGRYIEAREPDLPPLRVNQEGIVVYDPGAPEQTHGGYRARIRNENWLYQPLVKYPDLFLRFAWLADDGNLDNELDTEKNAAAALEWVETYGVLGLTEVKRQGGVGASTRGGVDDTVSRFAFEVWTANGTLRLYEAAMADGGPDVETIVSFASPKYRGFITYTPGTARQWALEQMANTVQERVARYCYPALYQQPNGGFVEGYDFTNLLGAVWLQALWLLTSDDVRRCKNWECNGVIAFEQPEQVDQGLKKNARGRYRTRKDKQFCSEKCKNRYVYLTVTKPARQIARTQ